MVLTRLPDLKPQIVGKKEFCENDTLQIAVTGSFSNYKWSTGESSNGIIINKGGTYKVTVSSGACTGIDSLKINMNPLPVLNTSSDTAVCAGQSAILSVNSGFSSYQWSSGETTNSITAATSGTYLVNVQSAKGCSKRDSVN